MSDDRNAVVEYISRLFAKEDFILNNLLAEQEDAGGPMMNIGPDQGKFLNLLVRLLRPKNVLEVGSYFGYSSVWLARALHDLNLAETNDAMGDLGATRLNLSQNCSELGLRAPKTAVYSGVNEDLRGERNDAMGDLAASLLTCVEVSKDYAEALRERMISAGLEQCVEVVNASGLTAMNKFIEEGRSFEMIFIDADKVNYPNYLELAAKLIPSGGLLLVDNVLWKSQVLDPNAQDKATQAIQRFNIQLAQSEDFSSSILTIQDGLAFAVRN